MQPSAWDRETSRGCTPTEHVELFVDFTRKAYCYLAARMATVLMGKASRVPPNGGTREALVYDRDLRRIAMAPAPSKRSHVEVSGTGQMAIEFVSIVTAPFSASK